MSEQKNHLENNDTPIPGAEDSSSESANKPPKPRRLGRKLTVKEQLKANREPKVPSLYDSAIQQGLEVPALPFSEMPAAIRDKLLDHLVNAGIINESASALASGVPNNELPKPVSDPQEVIRATITKFNAAYLYRPNQRARKT